jgi:hypothetical protein
MPAKCEHCGFETDILQTLVKEPKSFNRGTRTLCPACHAKSQFSLQKWLFLSNLLILFLGLFFRWSVPDDPAGWVGLNIFLFQVFAIVTIIPHA